MDTSIVFVWTNIIFSSSRNPLEMARTHLSQAKICNFDDSSTFMFFCQKNILQLRLFGIMGIVWAHGMKLTSGFKSLWVMPFEC